MHAVSFLVLLTASLASAGAGARATDPLPGATPSAPGAPGAATSAPSPHDRARNLVGGVWQCDTIAGSTGTHAYTDNDDGSIDMQSEVHAGFRTFRFSEIYRFDATRATWTVRTQGGAFVGSAPVWSGYKWIFDGMETQFGRRRRMRMIYFDLGDEALRRDFQTQQNGLWETYSAETCRRPSN